MDTTDKDELRRHLERSIGKEPSYEEKRTRKRRARERKAERDRLRPRRRRWDENAEAGELSDPRVSRSSGKNERGVSGLGEGRAGARPRDERAVREGLVVMLARARARVRMEGGEVEAVLADEIAREQTSRIAVGDRVRIAARGGTLPLVVEVLPRRTKLSRPDPGVPGRERLLAADVDVAVLVLAAAEPAFRPGLGDRFLVALAESGVLPLLCVNKVDLVREATARAEIERAAVDWREVGVDVLLVSAHDGEGLDALHARIAGRRCVFVGHSGVGKSSLLNALDPEGERATREVGRKGRHTTKASSLRALADGAELIDTPGVREFGLWGIDPAAVRAAFAEFEEPARACRFRDCTHVHEPECGVLAAVARRTIDPRRYATYRRMLGTVEEGR